MIAFVLFSLAIALAFIVGAYHGRETERQLLASGKVAQFGVNPILDFEAELRRTRGLRPLHGNPENAVRIKRASITR